MRKYSPRPINKVFNTGVGRRNESCRHKWLLLGALNGHFLLFTLVYRYFASVATCGDVATTCPPLYYYLENITLFL